MENNNEVRYELDNDTRYKMSLKKQGANNPNYNKPRDPKTTQKISDGLKKYHQQKKAFEEATKMSSVKRVWNKTKFEGFICFHLSQCNESNAVYEGYDLRANQITKYRVYYHHNNILLNTDFNSNDEALEFYEMLENPFIDRIINETKNKVIVLGFHK